jgi:hypothetical protein
MKILATGGGGRTAAFACAIEAHAPLRAPAMDDRQEHDTVDGWEKE